MRGLLIFFLVIGMVTAAGLFLFYSQKAVEAEVAAAIERGDVAGLAARIDFDNLRSFLKQDLLAEKNDKSPIGGLYAGTGPDISKIDAVVDYYVQPENIAILYEMRDTAAKDIPVTAFIVGRSFAPLYGFALTFGAPPELTKDSGARAIADRYRVRLVFRLRGFKWQVSEMHVPIFMVPAFTYSQPAVDIYAPRRR